MRYANGIIWGGLGYLVAQWAFLARLTWWDFNWDIMEPGIDSDCCLISN